jgi:hypothetical protein
MATLSRPVVESVRVGKIVGIRAGSAPYRFVGIWAVAVGNRVFVRTRNDKPTGWFRASVHTRHGCA